MENPVQVAPKRDDAKWPIYEFEGIRYYRRSHGYYQARCQDGYKCLHRSVWESKHGTIPKGFEIHHLDENFSNNLLANLSIWGISNHRSFHANKPEHIEMATRNIEKFNIAKRA